MATSIKPKLNSCTAPTAHQSGRGATTNTVTSKSKDENALYDDLRKETGLTANLVQKGVRRAIEAVQSGVEKLKQGEKTSQPEFDSWSVVYDKRSASFNDYHATLSTPNGRVTCKYVLSPEDGREDTPFSRYYESDDWDASSATLQYDEQEDTFYLHVTLRNPEYEVDGTERNAKKPGHVMTPPRTEWFSAWI